MSTTFAIKRKGFEKIDLNNENSFIEVAFQVSSIGWKNELGPYLPHSLKVYPIDNDNDEIFTIGDIVRKIEHPDTQEQ